MTGALEGCWWIVTFVPKGGEDKAHYRATGTEHFEGCLGSSLWDVRHDVLVHGQDRRTVADVAGDPRPLPPPDRREKGTGGFAGASGELSFHDVVDVSPPSTRTGATCAGVALGDLPTASRVVASTSSTATASSC